MDFRKDSCCVTSLLWVPGAFRLVEVGAGGGCLGRGGAREWRFSRYEMQFYRRSVLGAGWWRWLYHAVKVLNATDPHTSND